MRVLFLASRPPWPPTDGGRVLMAHTIDGLLARGHHVTVVTSAVGATVDEVKRAAPALERLDVRVVPDRRRGGPAAALRAIAGRRPLSVVRQMSAAVRDEVARLLEGTAFDVVHVEQVQAFPQAGPALARGLPVVIRAENVESDLWRALAAGRLWIGPLAAIEARRLARFERLALEQATATAAVTDADAARLRQLAPDASVHVVPAPMPADLPAGTQPHDGDPALVVLASAWHPNQDGVAWFVTRIWPAVASALPAARLHLFGARPGAEGPGVIRHPPAPDSREALAAGSILVVPLRFGSGVRVRILEAWARGVPVVATRAAIEGLDIADGDGVRVADTADAFVRALSDLQASRDARERLIRTGRARLAERHDPSACAAALAAVYRRTSG
jgi:glycosyltransferase involved in cell wall biosynthesis